MIDHVFDYAEPSTLAEATALLAASGEDARVLAGGTALVNLMKLRLLAPSLVVNLRRVPGLDAIRHSDGRGLHLGAMARIRGLQDSDLVRAHAPLLAEAAKHVATVSIRNKATVGGSLCHADPRSDLAPALLALDAVVTLSGPGGTRSVPLREFFRGAFQTAAVPGEILTGIAVPETPLGAATAYLRFTTHSLIGHPMAAVAVLVHIEDGLCREARVGLGAASSIPVRAARAEAALRSARPSARVLREVARLAAEETDPFDDPYASSNYKRHVCEVLVYDALTQATGLGAEQRDRGTHT